MGNETSEPMHWASPSCPIGELLFVDVVLRGGIAYDVNGTLLRDCAAISHPPEGASQ